MFVGQSKTMFCWEESELVKMSPGGKVTVRSLSAGAFNRCKVMLITSPEAPPVLVKETETSCCFTAVSKSTVPVEGVGVSAICDEWNTPYATMITKTMDSVRQPHQPVPRLWFTGTLALGDVTGGAEGTLVLGVCETGFSLE